jgi:hypothetical protein
MTSVPEADMRDSLLAASGGDTILSLAEISAVLSPSLEDASLLVTTPPISSVATAVRKSVAARAPAMNAANADSLDAEAVATRVRAANAAAEAVATRVRAANAASAAAAKTEAIMASRLVGLEKTLKAYLERLESSEQRVLLLDQTVAELRREQASVNSSALHDRLRILELEGGNLKTELCRVQLSVYDPAGEVNLIHEQVDALRGATRVGSGVERHGVRSRIREILPPCCGLYLVGFGYEHRVLSPKGDKVTTVVVISLDCEFASREPLSLIELT